MDITEYLDDFYKYKATCVDCYDGDTCKLEIDLGFGIKMLKTCRLYGINTPELRGSEETKQLGLEARDFLRSNILNKEVILHTIKDKNGKYGRLLGILFVKNSEDVLININKLMLDTNRAIVYK